MNTYAFGNSTYESHHIFPQRYFEQLGDSSCFQLREFEHKWVETSGGYTSDWENDEHWFSSFISDGNITSYGVRCAAFNAGTRILSYHLFVVDHNRTTGDGAREISGLTAWKFDFWSNIYYNIGYLCSIPAKIIHFWIYIIPLHNTFYGYPSIGYLIGWSLWESFVGAILSIVMLFVGSVIGFIAHPLWSLGGFLVSLDNPVRVNLLSSLYWLIASVIKSIWILVFW
jgi:hypothetical protein